MVRWMDRASRRISRSPRTRSKILVSRPPQSGIPRSTIKLVWLRERKGHKRTTKGSISLNMLVDGLTPLQLRQAVSGNQKTAKNVKQQESSLSSSRLTHRKVEVEDKLHTMKELPLGTESTPLPLKSEVRRRRVGEVGRHERLERLERIGSIGSTESQGKARRESITLHPLNPAEVYHTRRHARSSNTIRLPSNLTDDTMNPLHSSSPQNRSGEPTTTPVHHLPPP